MDVTLRRLPLVGRLTLPFVLGLSVCLQPSGAGIGMAPVPTASESGDTQGSSAITGPLDGDRFSDSDNHAWRGAVGEGPWWWQVDFGEARALGAILQIHSAATQGLSECPLDYRWQTSLDGQSWHDLSETVVHDEQDRGAWRGLEQVLDAGHLPIWASCGGAQGLAILAENGTANPWDCPHCRDPDNLLLPIYTHLGHLDDGPWKCGEYGSCLLERGPCQIQQVRKDPVFAGLPTTFTSMESHCGQRPPAGWVLLATAVEGGLTKTQCLRRADRPIYAAQFHLEMEGTPDSSRMLMRNFLQVATRWGGYNPDAVPLSTPPPVTDAADGSKKVREPEPANAADRDLP